MAKVEMLTNLGGCAHCKRAIPIVEEAVKKTGAELEIVDLMKASDEKVDHFREMVGGPFSTPLIAIDGKAAFIGKTPTVEEVVAAIEG